MLSSTLRASRRGLAALALSCAVAVVAQVPPGDATALPGSTAAVPFNPNSIPPEYPVPYPPASEGEIRAVMDRVLAYIDQSTPAYTVRRDTGERVDDLTGLSPSEVTFAKSDFRLLSYEWGVTYAGCLSAADVTGDARYREYATSRLGFVARVAMHFRDRAADLPRGPRGLPGRQLLDPRALDDCGAMSAAMIKALRAGVTDPNLRPLVDIALEWISHGQKRLGDGTLARDRPLADTLWLDDTYMGIPALAQMGALTGDRRYFDDAVRQLGQFNERMFVPERGLYRHGWTQGMDEHPAFYWGRANGWVAMAAVELLSVLPEDHPGRPAVLDMLRAHLRGLAACQGIDGMWHQLLDRPETYDETSASAMFVFAMARAINRGWVSPLVYGPVVSLGWNAVARQVNAQGQVENTCIGTGMGWDPTFYAYRPRSVYAAHGYGPVLLAGAEMITLRRGRGADATVHDGGVHYGRSAVAATP